MRYVFNAATVWVMQMAIFLSAICFIFGGAYAMEQGRHIEITSIYDAVTPSVRRVLGPDPLRHRGRLPGLPALRDGRARRSRRSDRMESSGQAWDVPIPAFQKTALAVGVAVMLAQALRQLVAAVGARGTARLPWALRP